MKKSKKMDRKLVSKQPHEIAGVAKSHSTTRKKVREVKSNVGRSRKKIDAALESEGLPKKSKKK